MFGHYSHYSCDTVVDQSGCPLCLIFEISEILSQYGATAARHSQSSVPECPTFSLKFPMTSCVYSGECTLNTACTYMVYSVQCKMLILPVNVKLKFCLGSAVTVINCEL